MAVVNYMHRYTCSPFFQYLLLTPTFGILRLVYVSCALDLRCLGQENLVVCEAQGVQYEVVYWNSHILTLSFPRFQRLFQVNFKRSWRQATSFVDAFAIRKFFVHLLPFSILLLLFLWNCWRALINVIFRELPKVFVVVCCHILF